MKKILLWVLLIVLCIQCSGISGVVFAKDATNEIAIYCAPDGNDSAAGTIDAPLATLDAARQMVQKVKNQNPKTPVTVYFRGGEYNIKSTTVFDKYDSGTEEAPITYKAYPGEQPIFYGATKVKISDFESLSKEEMARVPEEARAYVAVADLKKLGINHLTAFDGFGGAYFNQATEFIENIENTYIPFLFNNKEQLMAQYPNGVERYTSVTAVHGTSGFSDSMQCTIDSAGRIANWVNAKHAVLQGRGAYGYSYSRVRIADIDPNTEIITTKDVFPRGFSTNGQLQIANLLEELDVPGEYYIDTDELKLYFYPPYVDENVPMEVVSNEHRVVKMDDVSYVTFDGIDFHKHRAEIFELRNCDHISFLGCEFRNNAVMGIDTRYCTDILIDGCDFISMGSAGIRLDERYDSHYLRTDDESVRTDLTPDNNVVNNCYFWDVARQGVMYTGAIRVHGVGNKVTNCSMHDGRNSFIHFGGNETKILYNEMWQGVKCSLDMGMIYNGRNITHRGNETAYNYFHDWGEGIAEMKFIGQAFAVYDDDNQTGNNKHHNFFVSGYYPFQISGNYGCYVDYNVIAENDSLGNFMAHGYDTGGWLNMMKTFVFQQISQVYTLSEYERYDYIKDIFFLERWPGDSSATYNLLWHNGGTENYDKAVVNEGNIEVKQGDDTYYEYFNDPENRDFTIRTDIEVPEELKEYQKLQLDDIGIYVSETRETADYSLTPFRIYYPYNYKDNVNSKEAFFTWEQSEHADKYLLELASDPEFTDIVYEKETLYNFAYLDDLNSDKTVYYWRVTAINESVIYPETLMCSNGPLVFRTNLYDNLNTEALLAKTAEFEAFMPNLIEGTEIGNVPYGTIAEAQTVLDEAKAMLELKQGEQTEVDRMVLVLDDKLTEIRSSINLYYSDIKDVFSSDSTYITNGATEVVRTEDEVRTKTANPLMHGIWTETKAKFGYDTIYTMKVRTNFGDNASAFSVIALAPEELSGVYSWRANPAKGFMIVMKKESIELQVRDGVHPQVVLSSPQAINLGEYNDLELGIINLPLGQLYILNLNGQSTLSYYTTDMITEGDLYLTLHDAVEQFGLDIKYQEAKSPKIFLGTKESLGVVNFAEAMGSATVSTANGTKFSSDVVPNDYTIAGRIELANPNAEQGVIFRSTSPDLNGDHYKAVIKGNKIMLKEKTGDLEQIIAINDMDGVKSSADIRINARHVAGGLNITVEIDGKCYIDYVDTSYIHNAGYLGIFSNSASSFTLKAQ